MAANRNSFIRYAAACKKDWGSAWEPETWRGIEGQFERLRRLSEKHKFKVVFLAFPIVFQVYSDYVEDEPQKRLMELCRKYNFGYHDLLPMFRKSTRENHHLFMDYCHLTNDGHNLTARALARYLSANML